MKKCIRRLCEWLLVGNRLFWLFLALLAVPWAVSGLTHLFVLATMS